MVYGLGCIAMITQNHNNLLLRRVGKISCTKIFYTHWQISMCLSNPQIGYLDTQAIARLASIPSCSSDWIVNKVFGTRIRPETSLLTFGIVKESIGITSIGYVEGYVDLLGFIYWRSVEKVYYITRNHRNMQVATRVAIVLLSQHLPVMLKSIIVVNFRSHPETGTAERGEASK